MRKLMVLPVLLLFPVFLRAQCKGSSPTWTSTPDQASLSTCVTNASAGDTINVSAGTVTWSAAGIVVNKALSIIGAGQGTTVINDSIPTGATPTCSLFKFAPTVVGSLTRLSGMTLQPSGVSTVCAAFTAQGTCNSGGCTNLRIDHITFSGWATVAKSGNSYGITAVGDMFGVFDHDIVNGQYGNYLQLVEINHGSYRGVGQYGDNSWAQPEAYGSSNFLFFENDTFNDAGCCENEGGAGALNQRGGGRVVVRFSQFNNMDYLNFSLGWHGTESGGRPRSGRAFEFYGNSYACTDPSYYCGQVAGVRGGTGLVWGNNTDLTTQKVNAFLTLTTYRVSGNEGGQWVACDGTSPYDTNDGVTYYTGTVGSYDSGTTTITVSGSPGWNAGQWSPAGAPYSIHDSNQNNGSEITGNGSNTLTILETGGPGTWSPAPGDTIQILRATACMDQAGGRGAGALQSNNNPALPQSPVNQALSPTYLWANPFVAHLPNSGVGAGSYTARVMRNRDFYVESLNQSAQANSTSPFDGTTAVGMGHGTLANRPGSCTTGVAYWAQDQGNWNTTNTAIPGISGATQGQLFVCTSANTWSLYYTPYTYPHPLTSGGGGTTATTINPPTGLVATVQ